MWDFSIGRSVSIMMRTWPFIVFRMIVYFGITVAYIMATGTGASVGYGVGHISTDPDGPVSFALWGGVVGFGIVSIAVYWIREYILYVLKAGHIAVMVHLIDGHDVPDGQGQIAYAKEVVTQRFAEANILFVIDQLVKGAIRAITGLIGGVAAFLPIPGLSGIVSFINTVIRISLTYVDEIIFGYNIRINSSSPFEPAQQGRRPLRPERHEDGQERDVAGADPVGRHLRHLPAHAGAGWGRPVPHARPVERLERRAGDRLCVGTEGCLRRALRHRLAHAGLFQDDRRAGARSGMGPQAHRGVAPVPRTEGQGGAVFRREVGGASAAVEHLKMIDAVLVGVGAFSLFDVVAIRLLPRTGWTSGVRMPAFGCGRCSRWLPRSVALRMSVVAVGVR